GLEMPSARIRPLSEERPLTDETQLPTFGFPAPADTPTDVPLPGHIGEFRIVSILRRGGGGILLEAGGRKPKRPVAAGGGAAAREDQRAAPASLSARGGAPRAAGPSQHCRALRGGTHRGRPALPHDGARRGAAARRIRARAHGRRAADSGAASRPAAPLRDDL